MATDNRTVRQVRARGRNEIWSWALLIALPLLAYARLAVAGFVWDDDTTLACLASPGRTDEAKAQLEAVLKLRPDNETARQILAKIR